MQKLCGENRSRVSFRSDANPDGLDNYTIIKNIGGVSTSVVHLAVCKRGRLRDRQVAIKKIPRTTGPSGFPQSTSSTSIHQSLHHPSIVSLLSTFSTNTAYYHVLELCSRGTLSKFLLSREHPTLSESEVRGVLKSLVDALQYLRKERVIHRDIQPSNVFISDNYRIKLGGFGLATRLPVDGHTTETFCGSPIYASPEIVSRLPYGFTADVWSLGCLTINCLSGRPPSEADEIPKLSGIGSNAAYSLPEFISTECKSLISGLVQIDPAKRVALHSITSHPFFDPALPTPSLDPNEPTGRYNSEDLPTPLQKQKNTGSSQLKAPTLPPFPKKSHLPRNRGRHSEAVTLDSKKVLDNVGNNDLRRLLGNGVSSRIRFPGTSGVTRRIVSDPLPEHPGPLASELPPWVPRPDSDVTTPSEAGLVSESPEEDGLPKTNDIHPSLLDAYNKFSERINAVSSNHNSPETVDSLPTLVAACPRDPPVAFVDIPIGNALPSPFATYLLKPQVHKTIHGQLTILPSRSLLVDFREGERRRGKKGDEVFVVDPSGKEVKVYSAPHLSAPCCLAEAVAVYTTDKLPPIYWRSYNDARHFVEQIKQRTPMLVMYTTDAKCTLMSNTPQADIELLFRQIDRGLSSGKGAKNVQTHHTSMRIRLSRQKRSAELARYIPGPWGGEWTKKVLLATGEGVGIRESDLRGLHSLEMEGVERLTEFLRVCEAVECLDVAGSSSGEIKQTVQDTPISGRRALILPNVPASKEGQDQAEAPRPQKPNATTINIVRRPGKLPQRGGPLQPLKQAQITTERFEDDATTPDHSIAKFQTRFIPTLGWCIRYGPQASQGGRYSVMFLDGVTLNVNVDEDYVEFKDRSEKVSRYTIRDGRSREEIQERMNVYEEFVPLFEHPSGYQ